MAEPLTLAEAKAQLRKVDTSEDGLITSYIVAAREWVEGWTGHILVSRTITESFLEFGDYLTLRHRPVTALIEVAYTDDAGEEAEYEGGVLKTALYPATVYPPYGETFPTLGTDGVVTVQYTAGYANAGAVPAALKQAMYLLIGHWHSTRAGVSPDKMEEVPLAVKSLCGPYRVPPLA